MPETLHSLRQQLREKFPDAHQDRRVETQALTASLPAFPKGALSELSPDGPASGLSLVLGQLLATPKSKIQDPSSDRESPIADLSRQSAATPDRTSPIANHASQIADRKSQIADRTSPIALIDGRDSFDPASYGSAACSRLLWVRCHHAAESLRCADLLLRDGNLPLLTLDLQLTPLRELQDIPASSWYRLRNLARQSDATLLAFTPRHLIPCAALQLTFPSIFDLGDLVEVEGGKGRKVEGRRSESRRWRAGS
jgi:hypothetical protein